MGKCSCIKNNRFDFVLRSNGCDALTYEDMSEWEDGPNYEKPATYDIVFSMSGGGRRLTVKADGVNHWTPEQLGFEGTIPEGIICIKVETCEDTYIRYRLNACKTQCCLDQYVYQLIEKDARDSDFVKVERIQRLLGMAERDAERKNIEHSRVMFEEVKSSLEELNCNCKCK